MSLSRIANYLRSRGHASLHDIALHLDSEESAVEAMLEQWQRKGRVQKSEVLPQGCGTSCQKCSSPPAAVYSWKDDQAPPS
jgi:hypothetical protein